MTGLLPPSPDFEDERLYASVHSRLFGSGQQVMIGRYVVERRLGAGAMGVVHVARDAELDRRVAIKLVHAQLAAHDVAARMRGEAKALARLAHPNVVHVYEVGEHRGQVFLVMEYVDGSSLRAWIEQDNPAWSARLAAYVEAGRGLAAAHAAGLTHRDFKPDNVLRSADGRVRVADFGLACLDDGGDRLGDVELLETTVESGPMPALLRSRTGEIKGTPVYMPPEQFRGGPIDARADQFAYCVSLYEGLWGSRPFAEDSLRARLRAIQHEGPIAPAQLGGVPRAVWLAVQRGLAADPAARWPSMVELLAALEAVLAPKRRVVLVVAGLAVAAAVGFGLSDATRAEPIAAAPPDPCAQTSGPIDALWTPALREQLQAALPESSAIATLDAWADDWRTAAHAACADVHQRGLRSSASLDRRGVCLDRRLAEWSAVTDAITGGAVADPGQWVEWMAALGEPRACLGEATLASNVRAQAPEQAAAIAHMRRELVAVSLDAGRRSLAERISAIQQLLAKARELGWRPLIGEAALALGHLHVLASDGEAARERLGEALDLAERDDDIELAAKVWSELNRVERALSFDAERAAWTWQRQAALFVDVAAEPRQRARLASDLGQVHELAAEREQAEQALREAAQIYEQIGPTAAWEQAGTLRRLAALIMDTGRPDEALALYARARTLESGGEAGVAGRGQLDAATLLDEGLALFFSGETEQAIGRLEQGLARASVELGPRSEIEARIHVALAAIYAALEQPAKVRAHAELADTISLAVLGPGHPLRADVLSAVGTAAYLEGRIDASAHAYTQALAVMRRVKPDDSLEVAEAELNLAFVVAELGDRPRARALIEHCLPILEQGLPAGDGKIEMARAVAREAM